MKKSPEDRAKINTRRRERYAQDSEHRRSIRATVKMWRDSHPEACKAMDHRKYEKRKAKYGRTLTDRWANFLGHARRRHILVSIDKKWFQEHIWNQLCFYCGEKAHGGIDRRDNSLGYDTHNAVPCCRWCNLIKFTKTIEEMTEHIKLMLCHLQAPESFSDGEGI